MLRLIYLAHPFGGKPENVQAVEKILMELIAIKDHAFYSPLHATGFYYHKMSRLEGMAVCLEMLGRCDELWLYGDWKNSIGCLMEYAFAKGKGMPIKFIGGGD
jgi:hypothetical protein